MIRVLIVDDDFMVARIHAGYVARTPGFAVAGQVHTGTDAFRAVSRLRPDLVLLDIYLPDISGLDMLRRLRGEGPPEVDVFVVTAARDVDTVRQAMRGGVVNYLIKPFDYATLRERLERYAALRKELAEVSSAGQAEVDRAFSGTASGQVSRLPKGLTQETAALVEQALREAHPDLSASECAACVGLARVSARRYLEYFVSSGRAEVRLRYGAAGRPERRYRWRS
ncbi:response regulator [Actinomadura formosensis]|uniref:response regulator n=1 Tax=Actinomadura formosensis TaxID=60706 RepID=UPI00082C6146|nr:response regulator [Actinomadura formosensis]